MANSARIDELRKKFDENPRRYFAPLANEYRKSGDLQQAIFICQEYLPQQPGHMSGHIVYGQALYESNRFDEAQAVFETALSLDPENLIALKHLGDIARQAGDLRTARIWYQRVLEADPRNEEIAQLMISLLAAPDVPPPSPSPTPVVQAPPVGREPLSREPLRPTPAPAAASSAPAEPVAERDSALVVEKSEAEPATAASPTPPVVPDNAAPPRASGATKALDGQDFLSLDDFNLGATDSAESSTSNDGTSTANANDDAAEHAAAAAPAAPSSESNELHVESSEPNVTLESGFDLGTEDGPFEADPFAIASAPMSEAPEIELATDLRLGLPDDSSSEPMDEHRTAESLDGLQTFEPGVIDTLSTPSEPLEREEFFGPVPGAAAPVSNSQPPAETPVEARAELPEAELPEAELPELESEPPPAAQTFVTETMAELYLRQGHLESALDIYRQLVEQRPDDVLVRDRLRSVESRMRDEAAAAAAAAADSRAPVYGGPTIREFLSGLASRRTPIFAVAVERERDTAVEPVHAEAAHDDAIDRSGAADADSRSVSEADSESAPASSNGGSVSGSIDALFGGAEPSAGDAAAASTLQEAFANDGPETAPLRGVPAHTASSELSLDHVFKGNAPPPPDNDGFSFDQFFADEMTEAAPNSAGENPAASQPTDDIAQFNAWLNGLKKT